MNGSFENHVALITGAGSGIGLATVKAFAEAGAAVELVDHNEDKLRIVTEQLVAAGHRASSMLCDVTNVALILPAMTTAAIAYAPHAQAGIASGMLNVSWQIGGVIGVAILGTLVGNAPTFLTGMHLAFIIAGGVLVLSLVVAGACISEQGRKEAQDESVEKLQKVTEAARELI